MNKREVLATQSVQVSSSEASSNMSRHGSCFTCHICDTETPKTHMRAHLEGDKHKICLKIADVALERARKQLSLDVPPIYEQDSRTYYCDPCSVVLLAYDRTLHEKSEAHSENVQYYDVLRTFSAFYMNRDEAFNSKQSVATYSPPTQSIPTESKKMTKEAELQEVINRLKEATHIQSPVGSLDALDPSLKKALTGLKLTVDRTLHELRESVARKELDFDKAINNLKESAEKTLNDLKESAEIKHQTDVERSKFSEEAELEIYKFKNKLSKMNLVRKNKKKTNLPQQTDCVCVDDVPEKSKKMGSSARKRVKAFGSPKPNKS